MKIEVIAIEKLRPTPSNARKHGEANLKAIEESLRIFGQQKPSVALKDGTVWVRKHSEWGEMVVTGKQDGMDVLTTRFTKVSPTEAPAA